MSECVSRRDSGDDEGHAARIQTLKDKRLATSPVSEQGREERTVVFCCERRTVLLRVTH